jgi:hypothetical protein
MAEKNWVRFLGPLAPLIDKVVRGLLSTASMFGVQSGLPTELQLRTKAAVLTDLWAFRMDRTFCLGCRWMLGSGKSGLLGHFPSRPQLFATRDGCK